MRRRSSPLAMHGVNLAYSSSDNTIACNIVDSSNMGVAVGYNNGPCLRNEIHGVINGCTESTGSGGAFYISGNGHTVTSSRLTMTQNAGRSLYVDGNSCHVESIIFSPRTSARVRVVSRSRRSLVLRRSS